MHSFKNPASPSLDLDNVSAGPFTFEVHIIGECVIAL
jgi:hypothetical protein